MSVEARKKVFLELDTEPKNASKSTCQVCDARHNTILCDNIQLQIQTREPGMTANHTGNSAVIHPVVVVKINGYKLVAGLA